MFITSELAAGRKVGGYCSASPAWRFEQGGDLSDGFGAWADVPHRGTRVAVPGLGHYQLQGDALLAEVGRCGMPCPRTVRVHEHSCCDWAGLMATCVCDPDRWACVVIRVV